ncbi:MAG: YutD-like domain-containing protein [Bacilli bacterium]
MIEIENNNYQIIEGKDNFNEEQFEKLYTDYFYDYDYILGDYAYDRLRLKGFYEESNAKVSKINCIIEKENYLKNYCAYGAKYFLLKKVK